MQMFCWHPPPTLLPQASDARVLLATLFPQAGDASVLLATLSPPSYNRLVMPVSGGHPPLILLPWAGNAHFCWPIISPLTCSLGHMLPSYSRAFLLTTNFFISICLLFNVRRLWWATFYLRVIASSIFDFTREVTQQLHKLFPLVGGSVFVQPKFASSVILSACLWPTLREKTSPVKAVYLIFEKVIPREKSPVILRKKMIASP